MFLSFFLQCITLFCNLLSLRLFLLFFFNCLLFYAASRFSLSKWHVTIVFAANLRHLRGLRSASYGLWFNQDGTFNKPHLLWHVTPVFAVWSTHLMSICLCVSLIYIVLLYGGNEHGKMKNHAHSIPIIL